MENALNYIEDAPIADVLQELFNPAYVWVCIEACMDFSTYVMCVQEAVAAVRHISSQVQDQRHMLDNVFRQTSSTRQDMAALAESISISLKQVKLKMKPLDLDQK